MQSKNDIFLMHTYINIYRYVHKSSLYALLGFLTWWWRAGMVLTEFRFCQLTFIFSVFLDENCMYVCHSWQTLSEQLSRIPNTKFFITMEKHVQKQERNAFQTFLNCLRINKDFRQLRLLPLFKNPESFYSFTRSIPFFLLNSWCMWFVYLGQVGLSENFRGNQRAKCVLMLNFTSTFVLPNN